MPRDLPLSNGKLYVAFDHQHAIRDLCFPYVGMQNHAMGRSQRLAVRAFGVTRWLGNDGFTVEQDYEPNAQVTQVRARFEAAHQVDSNQRLQSLHFQLREAVHPERRSFLRTITIVNASDHPVPITVFSHFDLEMGESDALGSVSFDPESEGMLHWRRDAWLLSTLRGPGDLAWSCDARSSREGRGCGGKIEDGEAPDFNAVSVGSVDAYLARSLEIPPSSEIQLEASFHCGRDEPEVQQLARELQTAGAAGLFSAAVAHDQVVNEVVDQALWPLPDDLKQPAQRIARILLAQISDNGAINAAIDSDTLNPGRESYAYLWPRDGALIAHLLNSLGLESHAKAFFVFLKGRQHSEGWLHHRYHIDGSVGSTWLPRLRNGHRENPFQEDETSLTTWAAASLARKDIEWAKSSGVIDELIRPCALWLSRFIDKDSQLPLPSWDLWEERYGVHAFTVGTVIIALTEAAALLEEAGAAPASEIEALNRAAAETRERFEKHFYHEDLGTYARMISRSADGGWQLDTTPDASLCGLVQHGVIAPSGERWQSTHRRLRNLLGVKTPVGGYARYLADPFLATEPASTEVPGNPWILCTLAMAECDLLDPKAHLPLESAEETLRWALNRARPSGVLPEQVHPRSGAAEGVSPLTWSHAAWLSLALRWCERANPTT